MLYLGTYWLWDLIFIILIILAFIMGFFIGLLPTIYFIIGVCLSLALMVTLQTILVDGWTIVFKNFLLKIIEPNEIATIALLKRNTYFYSYYLLWISLTFFILLSLYFLIFRHHFKKIALKNRYQRYISSIILAILVFFVIMVANVFLATNLFYTTKTIQGIKINELVTKSILYSISDCIIGKVPGNFDLSGLFLTIIN